MLCVLGVSLIAFPHFFMSAIGIVCGLVLIVFGIIRLMGYFSKDLYRLAFQYDLAFGILMIALGAIMLWHPEALMLFFSVTLGLSCLCDGLFKIQIAIDAKRFGIYKWWLILAFSLVTVLFGIILMASPFKSVEIMMFLAGITMICDGIMNISTVITAVKIINHQRPDIIEEEKI